MLQLHCVITLLFFSATKVSAEAVGTLRVTSMPSTSEVIIDGSIVGKTPYSGVLPAGIYSVTTRYAGFNPETKSVTVLQNDTTEVDFVLSEVPKITIYNVMGDLYIDESKVEYNRSTHSYVLEGNVGESHEIKIIPYSTLYKPFIGRVNIHSTPQNINISYPINYIKENECYAELGVVMNPALGAALTAGYNCGKLNFEAAIMYTTFSKDVWTMKERDYFYSNTAYKDYESYLEDCQSNIMASLKFGYNLSSYTRIRLTPQIGIRYVQIDIDGNYSYCINGMIGARLYYALSSSFGISLSPAYCIGVVKGSSFKKAADYVSAIGDLSNGYDLRLSFVVNF